MGTQANVERVEVLIEKVTKLINETRHYPRSNVYLDIVVLALLSKSLIVGKAVCKLVERGFYEEAFGLTRTIVDLYFTIRYITNRDCEERAQQFTYFFAKDREGWTAIIQKYYPSAQIKRREYPVQILEKAKEYKHPHKWTGLGDQTRQMAMEDDTHELDQSGKPFKCQFDYEVMYKWTSHYVHPTVVVLDTHITESIEPFTVHARKELKDELRPLALLNVVAYLNKILICAFRSLGTEFPLDLSNDFDAVMKSF